MESKCTNYYYLIMDMYIRISYAVDNKNVFNIHTYGLNHNTQAITF